MTLGARPIKSFYDTTYKIAFPGILSGLILTWLRCMGEFGATLMVGGLFAVFLFRRRRLPPDSRPLDEAEKRRLATILGPEREH